jgi:hypothetical protein
MTVVLQGPKRPVNMTLNEALVREARTLTRSLSDTVEALLAAYVEAEKLKRADGERRIESTIDHAITHYEEFGVVGAEYSPVEEQQVN